MGITRLTADIFGEPFHFGDQPPHGSASPDLESALEGAQMPRVIAIRISRLECSQQLACRLIRIGVQALEHFCTIRLKLIRTTAGAWFG